MFKYEINSRTAASSLLLDRFSDGEVDSGAVALSSNTRFFERETLEAAVEPSEGSGVIFLPDFGLKKEVIIFFLFVLVLV